MVRQVGILLQRSSLGRLIYERISAVRSVWHHRRNGLVLRFWGAEVLRLVHARLHGKIHYFLDYGSLLGCIRDGMFLKHDDDIDFGVMPGVKPRVLVELLHGTKLRYLGAYEYAGEIRQVAYTFRGMSVDFFFNGEDGGNFTADAYYRLEGRVYDANKLSCYRFIRPVVGGTKTIVFAGVSVDVPINAEELLAAHYGKGWRVPDTGWRANKPREDQGVYRRILMPGIAHNCISEAEVLAR